MSQGVHVKQLLHLIVQGREQHKAQTKLERARQLFGAKFANELGTTWTPSKEPCLTRWLAGRPWQNVER